MAHCNGQMGGGEQVKNNKELPYIVQCGKCTGVIIHKHYVMTAGHCLRNSTVYEKDGTFVTYKKVTIAAGDYYLTLDEDKLAAHRSETRKFFDSDELIPHPKYANNMKSPKYDLGLLYFKEALFEDGNEHINSIQMVTAGHRWSFPDPNVYFKHLRTVDKPYEQSIHDGDYRVNGKLRSLWTTSLPVDHYKSRTGAWVEYVPPYGSICWMIGLGFQGQKKNGKNKDGKIKYLVKRSTHIKTRDRVRIQSYERCNTYSEFDRDRSFCFGRGLNHGGQTYGGDSGGPVICKNPSEKEYKLYGIMSRSNLEDKTDAVRLAHPELNHWVNGEIQKQRNQNNADNGEIQKQRNQNNAGNCNVM